MISIGFCTKEEMRQRTIEIAAGDISPSLLEPKIWFSNIDTFIAILSDKDHEITRTIRRHHLNEEKS